jgi:hypothetical protein
MLRRFLKDKQSMRLIVALSLEIDRSIEHPAVPIGIEIEGRILT